MTSGDRFGSHSHLGLTCNLINIGACFCFCCFLRLGFAMLSMLPQLLGLDNVHSPSASTGARAIGMCHFVQLQSFISMDGLSKQKLAEERQVIHPDFFL